MDPGSIDHLKEELLQVIDAAFQKCAEVHDDLRADLHESITTRLGGQQAAARQVSPLLRSILKSNSNLDCSSKEGQTDACRLVDVTVDSTAAAALEEANDADDKVEMQPILNGNELNGNEVHEEGIFWQPEQNFVLRPVTKRLLNGLKAKEEPNGCSMVSEMGTQERLPVPAFANGREPSEVVNVNGEETPPSPGRADTIAAIQRVQFNATEEDTTDAEECHGDVDRVASIAIGRALSFYRGDDDVAEFAVVSSTSSEETAEDEVDVRSLDNVGRWARIVCKAIDVATSSFSVIKASWRMRGSLTHLTLSAISLNQGLGFQEKWSMFGPRASRRLRLTMHMTQHGALTSVTDSESRWWTRLLAIKCMLHPYSLQRLVWDVFGFMICCHDLFLLPMESFELPLLYLNFLEVFQRVTTVFWSADILISTRTGYQTEWGDIEDGQAAVLWNYVRTWFILDFLLTANDWLSIAGLTNRITFIRSGKNVLRILRAVRLLRLVKLLDTLKRRVGVVRSELLTTTFGIVKLLVSIIVLSHYIACLWYYIGLRTMEVGPSWLSSNTLREDFKSDWLYAYLTSAHWALTQFTPASMEVVPANSAERGFTCCVIVMAMVIFSYFVGRIQQALSHLRMVHAMKLKKDSDVRAYFSQSKTSYSLAARVWHFLKQHDLMMQSRMYFNQVQAFQQLPRTIREDLLEEDRKPMLASHPIFKIYAQVAPVAFRRLCVTAVETIVMMPTEDLFPFGTDVNRMIFVIHGLLHYMWSDRIPPYDTRLKGVEKETGFRQSAFRRSLRTNSAGSSDGKARRFSITGRPLVDEDGTYTIAVLPGQWACEECLWGVSPFLHGPFEAGPQGCELLAVKPDEFEAVIKEHVSTARLMVKYAEIFIDGINEASADEDCHDILFNRPDTIAGMAVEAANECDYQVDLVLRYRRKSYVGRGMRASLRTSSRSVLG
eukprot:TRINITY_DN4765_c0_g4_i1.p1 TRINITY_DN4765_c0_g4~~TRINITY_DN4765_c0_g4_i1.p1  ORF type:complete len:947 (+),score=202.80 TRINITY_DN4765_c0_g4_i1:82-2922(+)